MTTLDHRSAQTRVRDQGQRRTCAAHAVTAAHDWIVGDERSVEWALWAAERPAHRADAEACWPQEVATGVRREGQVSEQHWPYGEPAFPATPPSAAIASGDRPRLAAGRHIARGLPVITDELRDGKRVVLTVGVERKAWSIASNDGWIRPVESRPASGSHAVLVVGAVQPDTGDSALIIKNSWGPRWGDAGYGYLSEAYLTTYAIDAVVIESDDSADDQTEEDGA